MYIAGVGRISTEAVEKKRGVSMKRLGVYMLTLCLFFFLLVPVPVKADNSSMITVDGFEYKILDEKNVRLTGYQDSEDVDSTNPAIPSNIVYEGKTYQVTEFVVYRDNTRLKKLTLPEGIKKIQLNELGAYPNLEELHLPSTLEDINAGFCYSMENLKKIVFAGQETNYENDFYQLKDGVLIDKKNQQLLCYPAASPERTDYTVPDGIKTVVGGCFANVKNLENITMSSTVKEVYGGALTSANIKSIDFNNVEAFGVSSIRVECFDKCKRLETVKIGPKMKTGSLPFYENDSLKNIIVAKGNPYFHTEDGVLFGRTDAGKTLICYPAGKILDEYTVPEDTQVLASYSFSMCNLKKLVVPKSVSKITGAFNYGDDGKSKQPIEIDFLGDVLPQIGKWTFKDLYNGSKILFKNQSLVDQFNQGNKENEYIYSQDSGKDVEISTMPETHTESISLNQKEIMAVMDEPGEKTWQLISRVVPYNSTDAVKFSSSDESVATVNEFGVVKAGKKLGSATITASCGGKQAECNVVIKGNMSSANRDDIYDCVKVAVQSKGGKSGEPEEAYLYVTYDRKPLVEGKDYTVSYRNNIGGKNGTCKELSREKVNGDYLIKGMATVIITGIGNFTGKTEQQYEISWWEYSSGGQTPQPTPLTTEQTKPTVPTKRKITYVSNPTNATYTGKNIVKGLSVKAGKTKLKLNRDYTISYAGNKNCGKAKMVISGKGSYSGTYVRYFKIKPKKAKIKKLKAGKKKITVYVSRSAGNVSGYQIRYSTYKSFKKSKYKTTKKTAYTLKKLSKKKRYYVKIRAYKIIDGRRYYGSYSSYKKIKVR